MRGFEKWLKITLVQIYYFSLVSNVKGLLADSFIANRGSARMFEGQKGEIWWVCISMQEGGNPHHRRALAIADAAPAALLIPRDQTWWWTGFWYFSYWKIILVIKMMILVVENIHSDAPVHSQVSCDIQK